MSKLATPKCPFLRDRGLKSTPNRAAYQLQGGHEQQRRVQRLGRRFRARNSPLQALEPREFSPGHVQSAARARGGTISKHNPRIEVDAQQTPGRRGAVRENGANSRLDPGVQAGGGPCLRPRALQGVAEAGAVCLGMVECPHGPGRP